MYSRLSLEGLIARMYTPIPYITYLTVFTSGFTAFHTGTHTHLFEIVRLAIAKHS